MVFNNKFKYSKPVIGLVGAPGAGKSSIARCFAELGGGVINADQLAHKVLNEDDVRKKIITWWGEELLDSAGAIDRKKLAAIVFNEPQKLKNLESIIHPKVAKERKALRDKYLKDSNIVVIIEDSPLLLENKLDKQVDIIIFIKVPKELRLKRLSQSRGWSKRQVESREKSQLPLDTKMSRADYIIDNSYSKSDSKIEIARILSKIL